MRPMIPWLALTLGLAACQTDRPTASSTADLTAGKEGAVRVYTQNLYIGADVDKVIGTSGPAPQRTVPGPGHVRRHRLSQPGRPHRG